MSSFVRGVHSGPTGDLGVTVVQVVEAAKGRKLGTVRTSLREYAPVMEATPTSEFVDWRYVFSIIL